MRGMRRRKNDTAEEIPVSKSGSTVTAKTGCFFCYTVEFTYGELRYVPQGGKTAILADVIEGVGLQGEPTETRSSDPVFSVEKRDVPGRRPSGGLS